MAIEGFADNETEHMVLAGSVLALLIGGVAYTAVHNRRHRYEFDFLQDQIDENGIALREMLPGYEAELDQLSRNTKQNLPSHVLQARARTWSDRANRLEAYERERMAENEADHG